MDKLSFNENVVSVWSFKRLFIIKLAVERDDEHLDNTLFHLINLCLKKGIYKDEWKVLSVKPIFKSWDTRKCENYLYISILPIVSKAFEKDVSLHRL